MLLFLAMSTGAVTRQAGGMSVQETHMLSQAVNRTMPHSRNQLEEGVNHKEIIFYLAIQF